MSKRAAITLVAVLWLLEWVFGWSQHLGKVGDVIGTAWLVLLGYFVFESRHWRIPRGVHTWLWMTALLVVSVFRAWWIGATVDGFGLFAELVRQFPESHHVTRNDTAIVGALLDIMAGGLVAGIAGAFEAMFIAGTSWIADRFRKDREPPRVGLFPRVAVMVLQAPIFMVVMGAGLAAVGGAAVLATHGVPPGLDGAREYVPWIAGVGVAGWALATFHLGRLYALAGGSVVNRIVLAVIGILAAIAVVALGAHSLKEIVVLVGWVGAQLVALRFASV